VHVLITKSHKLKITDLVESYQKVILMNQFSTDIDTIT